MTVATCARRCRAFRRSRRGQSERRLGFSALGKSPVVWITRRRAAEIIGCSTNTVDRFIHVGELHPCAATQPRAGSLDQDEVAALAARRAIKREAATRTRQERDRRKPKPPDGEHQWLTPSQAARVVGMSTMGVYKRVQRGTIPYTDHRGRHWLRADHMELLANARLSPPST
jgi:hypothetical protein